MEDKMKEFIEAHYDEFEVEIPRESTWEKVANEIPTKKKTNKWLMRIAAAVIIMLGVGGLISILDGGKSGGDIAEDQSSQKTVEEIETLPFMDSEMEEVEQYYMTQVSMKQKELVDYEVDEELLLEVELLKEEFEALKIEMGQAADPAKVVEAMIENYQMRLEILKDILQEMRKEEMNKNNTRSDEQII